MLASHDLSTFLRKLGVSPEDVLMLFAGFPCETYSYCGHCQCNFGRITSTAPHGANYRKSQAQGAPFCDDPQCNYSQKAKQHGSMLQDLKRSLEGLSAQHGTKFAIENPVDEMKNLPFMQKEEWNLDVPCNLQFFDNCACQPRHRCKKS